MSENWQEDMKNFHRVVMGDYIPIFPEIPDKETIKLRQKLIDEEVNETLEAMYNNDMIEIADGIVDSIVVLIGTAVMYGIDLQPIWDEVYLNNMSKKDGPLREDGKKMKPLGWKPPDIKTCLIKQGWTDA